MIFLQFLIENLHHFQMGLPNLQNLIFERHNLLVFLRLDRFDLKLHFFFIIFIQVLSG